MIKYALVCDKNHEFASWFPDSDGFDSQARRGFVTCPECHSAKVRKAIMAPSIATRRSEPVVATAPEVVAVPDERETAMRAMMRKIRSHIADTAEDVGPRFPSEARAMHDGDIEPRAIVGQATLEEARDLIEDGIAIMPVPILPEDRH